MKFTSRKSSGKVETNRIRNNKKRRFFIIQKKTYNKIEQAGKTLFYIDILLEKLEKFQKFYLILYFVLFDPVSPLQIYNNIIKYGKRQKFSYCIK